MKGKKRNEIRREMQKVVANLDSRWMKVASKELSSHLCQLLDHECGRDIRRVLAWTSFFPGEADLSLFLDQQFEKRSVYLPRSLPDHTMTFIRVQKDWDEQPEYGPSGIPEPAYIAEDLFRAEEVKDCVIIVPGLAFDRFGNRIGRGKGYYDRFLGKAEMKGALTIGVCWKLQLIDQVPVKEHDVSVDWVCHEEGAFDTSLEFGELSGEIREEESSG